MDQNQFNQASEKNLITSSVSLQGSSSFIKDTLTDIDRIGVTPMFHNSNNMIDEKSSTDELTASDLHSLLAVERRRLILDILTEGVTTVELKELVVEVVEREDGIDTTDEDVIDRVTIGLHHNHLPRLDDAGLVDYDPDSHTVDPSKLSNYQLEE
ncbi:MULTISPECIES: hypothetical protein [unclassified Haladaptatus]|uniref:DUF7344 domain-containing protein n=1 Tax=unclassified Haladaptatus TaxID=2622732 RepID=UPI00209BEA82|nr:MULTISPECIES: hypothetical protein [unclassified Haladaptatus]MCO8244951.1 hypothetical protein [Haladaptatus sp. AB643]MCO8255536.1 hypothetical protein [Haladaptatus sp. AB618]